MKAFKVLALSTVAVGIAFGTASAQELIVNSYGGPYQKIIEERIIEPFEKEFGIKVIYDAAGSSSQDYAKIKATNGHPGFDVNVMTASQSLSGCKDGLLEKLTVENVPNLAMLDEGVRAIAGECGAVHEIQYMSLLWRTDKFDPAPDSWMVLADPDLKGKIILPKFANIMSVYLMQVLSTMNGGTLDDIGPGIAAMAELAPQALAFEQSSAIMGKYIREDQVYVLPYWSGRSQLLKDEGLSVDFTIPKEGTVPLIATLNVPTGAQNKEAALKFVNFFLEKSSQEAWVTGYNVGSIRSDLDIPDDVRAKQITSSADIEKLHLPDLQAIADHLDEWGDRWKREVISKAQ